MTQTGCCNFKHLKRCTALWFSEHLLHLSIKPVFSQASLLTLHSSLRTKPLQHDPTFHTPLNSMDWRLGWTNIQYLWQTHPRPATQIRGSSFVMGLTLTYPPNHTKQHNSLSPTVHRAFLWQHINHLSKVFKSVQGFYLHIKKKLLSMHQPEACSSVQIIRAPRIPTIHRASRS